MTRLLACIAIAGCYTSASGEKNLCIPGHDGLCPAPQLDHNYGLQGVVTVGEPAAVVKSFDDFSTTVEEIEIDAETRTELPYAATVHEGNVSLACGTFCVAAWQNPEGFVVTATRDAQGWLAPFVHDGKHSTPAVATAGDIALVAWQETDGTTTQLELRRLDGSGNLLGATTVAECDRSNISLTAGPSGFLLTWHRIASPQRWFVAQALDASGVLVDIPFEQPNGGGESYKFIQTPSAYVDGAFRIAHHALQNDATWAIVDPVARTIVLGGPPGLSDLITSITPLATGGLVSLFARQRTGQLVSGSPTLLRVENDAIVAEHAMPGAPRVAPAADHYLLVYGGDGTVSAQRHDLALEPLEAPRVIAESYQVDNTTCSTSRGHGLAIVGVVVGLVLRRRRRR